MIGTEEPQGLKVKRQDSGPIDPTLAERYWVAVKELKLSYYIGETRLFTLYTHYGNLMPIDPTLVEQYPSLTAGS